VTGARASARLYSLVQCAKVNGFEPYAYLRRVFTELPRAQSLGDIEALLATRLTPADLTRGRAHSPSRASSRVGAAPPA